MSARIPKPSGPRSLRQLATRRASSRVSVDLAALSSSEIRDLVHELEVHKIELEIQNQQLREAQHQADESRERYRRLYDSAPIGFVTLDLDGAIVEANLSACGLLKITRSRLIGRKFSRLIASWHQDRWHLERRRVTRGARRSVELEVTRPDGSTLRVRIVGSGSQLRGAQAAMLSLALIDISELRGTERALRVAAAAAALAEQSERRALASDLHDDAGQLLSLASIKLRAVTDGLAGGSASGIEEVTEMLAEVRQRVSSLSFQLSPPLLHDVGLVAAAQWLAEDLERRYGLVVHVNEHEKLELEEVARVSLFRAMRELLINVTKHAEVREARVRIWQEGGMARVGVEDSGVGFSVETSRRGFGLLALRERLEQLGGGLDIESVMGSGTRVVASLPLLSIPPDVMGGPPL
jgi:PAS domain S-box-containing protein